MAGRYLVSETPYVIAKFLPGNTVTIDIYTMAGVAIVLPPGDDACTEIGATGVFQWRTGLLPVGTIPAAGITKLLFVMDNGAFTVEDTKEWGGYPDLLVGLSQMNVYMDKPVYNPSHGGLETLRMRIYDTAVNVGTASGVIATLNLTAVITGPGQFSSWKQVKA